MELIKQEQYTLDMTKKLNITGMNVTTDSELAGLNTRNCIDGMIVSGTGHHVSFVTGHTVGCHKISGTTYEFLMARASANNDFKGIGDLMEEKDEAPFRFVI